MTILVPQKSQPALRKLIRLKVKELLLNKTDLADHWSISRPKNIWELEMPCGLIYFTNEDSDHEKTSPRTYKRILTLNTEVLIQDEQETVEIDDYLDSRSFEIESILMYDRFMGFGNKGPVEDISLIRTVPTVIKADGQQDVAAIRLFWEIVYRTDSWNDDTLVEFLKFYNDISTTIGAKSSDHVTIREA